MKGTRLRATVMLPGTRVPYPSHCSRNARPGMTGEVCCVFWARVVEPCRFQFLAREHG